MAKVGDLIEHEGVTYKAFRMGAYDPCEGCAFYLNEGCTEGAPDCENVTWRVVEECQVSNIGKVFVMDIEDYNVLANLARELMQSWDGLTMGQSFEKRRSIAKKQLYRLRGSIMNMEDLGL